MPLYGSHNVLSTFQCTVDVVSLKWYGNLSPVFVDDIVTLSRLSLKHTGYIRKVLTLLRTADVTLKLKNVDYSQLQLTTCETLFSSDKLKLRVIRQTLNAD